MDNQRTQGTPSTVRHENPPARMFSISHQPLLSSTSVDSGTSSSQAVLPLSPPVLSVVPVTEIREGAQTDDRNDYTSLVGESDTLYASEEPQQNNHSNVSDYASLMTTEISDMTTADQNPYQKLQATRNSETNQSEAVVQNPQSTIPSARDPRVSYPSMTRSTKSDTHDYESIFNESASSAVGSDYTEYGPCRENDGDYHEYHVCGASNSSERHEYFVLENQSNEYFVLEKAS